MKTQTPKPSSLARSHVDGLTLTQQSAVDLLAAGKNDGETAELLKLNRCSVTRWRLYSPEFRAALAVRRADVWGAAAARLQALIPKCVDVLAEALDTVPADEKPAMALAILKLAGTPPVRPVSDGETNPDYYVRDQVKREREQMKENVMASFDVELPELAGHLDRVRNRLARQADGDEGDDGEE